ncbi:MAG: ABC transporter ATP-binding protein [Spirochaetota bacterium]
MEKALIVNNLKLYYYTSAGIVKAVDDVSFDLNEGETLGLVGESGCGKTTTGFALLGMPTPPGKIVGGQVIIDGEDITKFSENELRRKVRWEKISMVFQGAMNCLTPVYTVGELMTETYLQHRPNTPKEPIYKQIIKYLNLVGLSEDIYTRYPHELSGGMKQRVVIATALFLEPKIVILDEPTTGLDVVVQAQILNLIKELKQNLSISSIFITHDLATEAEISDRICVMYAGKVMEIGTNEQIYGRKNLHPYTEKLLSATPLLHKKVDELSFIPGVPPDLIDPPKGCRFYERCHVHMDRCINEEPSIKEIEAGHFISCWRY